ncbi:TonB-dependent receptor domain-containing protein [Thalassolituus marinus]|uniref:TonB-dependent receptor n=1 Tax=Thalassolituus marinus TaxID=671053 RepID=A0ABS7ZUZ0_9GAMM|nr:Plug domain-containing protein [Thalassolituus marinus]MCA6064928.1 TonB-dependent receptor [Thalassolituus marinus]
MHHRIALLSFLLPFTAVAANQDIQLDTQVTEASSASVINTGPVNLISAEQLESVNIINAEDAVRDQPGVIVRKRYIGDPNATLGMRGSNMFQTARTLVFADGMPLHYLLQTRYSGAPRWSQNLTLTWHQTAALNISASVRHASNSYNELDNSDHESAVFGAIDAYTFIDAKARWQINRNSWASLGVDNLNNASAYVHHPYPQRTLFIEGSYRF